MEDKELLEELEAVQKWLEVQDEPNYDSEVGFDHDYTWIINPFYEETGRFKVNPFSYYGEDNIRLFLDRARKAGVI